MDVGGWLRGLGLGQYETNFRDNKINADLGLPDDPGTKALFEFIGEARKK